MGGASIEDMGIEVPITTPTTILQSLSATPPGTLSPTPPPHTHYPFHGDGKELYEW